MHIEFITDDSERSIAPYFSEPMIAKGLNSILILSIALILAWPKYTLSAYFQNETPPFAFLVVFETALLLHSYLNLRCGRGEISKELRFYWEVDAGIYTYEQERGFWSYTFLHFIIHSGMLMLSLLPILIISTAISGTSYAAWSIAVVMILITAFLCRLFGFLIFLTFGRGGLRGFLLTRSFWCALIFATAWLEPDINPGLLILQLHEGADAPHVFAGPPFSNYLIFSMAAVVVLAFINAALVRKGIRQRKQNENGIAVH